jgi:hypothetical protein
MSLSESGNPLNASPLSRLLNESGYSSLAQDNLSTHSIASLYLAFPRAEARRLLERFEIHYTQKHGSWLDLAESELPVLYSQCLDRRIPDAEAFRNEVAAWTAERNKAKAKAAWRFTTEKARVKFSRLYPLFG